MGPTSPKTKREITPILHHSISPFLARFPFEDDDEYEHDSPE